MNLNLAGKSALVTGSTGGIGFAIAETLAAEGVLTYINGRTEERVERAMSQIAANVERAKLKPMVADLSHVEGCETVIKTIPKLDILINNFGIYEVKPFEAIDDADWIRFFESNVLSGIRLSRHYFSSMKEAHWGRIIFIASESGIQIPSEMIHYGMTKTAQIAVARGLAELSVGTGVTINSVLPGPTMSEGVKAFMQAMAKQKGMSETEIEHEFFTSVRPSSLLKRFIDPMEIAHIVAFIASPLSVAMNGSAVRAEGGIVKSI